METYLLLHLLMGLLIAGYIILKHMGATWKYFKELYTAKKVKPTKIKTYFGFQYWCWFDNDSWVEIVFISTLVTLAFAFIAIFIWPVTFIFFLNRSIEKARARIEDGD